MKKLSPEKMKQLRLRKKITLKEAAQAAGYKNASSILRAEKGILRPPADRLMALADLYGVNVEEFFEPARSEVS